MLRLALHNFHKSSEDQYRGAGGSSSGSPPASLLVVPQPLTAKPTHSSHLNPHIGGPHPPRKYQCKMCPQIYMYIRQCSFDDNNDDDDDDDDDDEEVHNGRCDDA
ncbi:hypothetical protein PV325_001990 [Microctonus aethiopoides]|nr:hypothetical protein PV325_001990 [Microctonus aethiopoides]